MARFSTDDRRVVSVAADETLRIWDISAQKQVSLMKPKISESGTVMVVTKNAAQIAFSTANDRRLVVVDGPTKAELIRIELTEPEVYWRAVSPDLKWGLSNGIRNESTFWNLETKASFQIDNGHHNYCGCFTHDSTRAILGGGHSWDLWDFQSVMKIKEGSVTGGHVYVIGLIPESDRLFVGLADGNVWLFDRTTGQKVGSFKAHEKPLNGIVVSPDQKSVITQDQSGIFHLWRMAI